MTVKSLSNPRRHDDQAEIQFDSRASSDLKKCPKFFWRQFIVHPSVDKAKRRVTRHLRKMLKDCVPLALTDEEVLGVITRPNRQNITIVFETIQPQ